MDRTMYINRNAVVIKAKQPFVDWVNATPKADEEKGHVFTLAEINADCEVLLIPDYDSLEESRADIGPLNRHFRGRFRRVANGRNLLAPKSG